MSPKIALGYTEWPNQSRDDAGLAMVFVRSETLPIVQAAATILSLSGFEARRHVSFLVACSTH